MFRLIFNSGGLAQIKFGIKKIMALNLDTGDRTWGHLASTEHFGRATDASDYMPLTKDELKTEPYRSSSQASHCMIYAKNYDKTFGVYNPRAAVLMQLRFDGYIGFPGGLVDPGESSIAALHRELKEEMNVDLKRHVITESNYVVSHYSKSQKLILNFYVLEVSLQDLIDIERDALLAKDFGTEVLGTMRVPLYTMGDGYRGFPNFLSNAFIGNSKEQLTYTLTHCNIMCDEDISKAKTALPLHA